MMEAAPSAPLVVAETDFLLELLPVGITVKLTIKNMA
jgi:hypothetical protein